jgi:hypothetical protein
MFQAIIFIASYSYLIFTLGLLGLLNKNIIIISSFLYLILIFFINHKFGFIKINFKKHKFSKLSKFYLSIIFLQAIVNLIGALGPELSFDALWYHLTIPKVFLENSKIFHISGNLLYYSDLPKNIDLIYLSILSFSNEILVKLIHFSFGIFSLLALYKLSKKFITQENSLLACLVFYSSLVVGWQSTTSYIDLGITFFEIITLFLFFEWLEKKNIKYLFYTAISLGLSLSSKISVLNSIVVFTFLTTFIYLNKKITLNGYVKSLFLLITVPILITLPWFIFSFINTGNPIYPLFNNNFTLTYDRNPINIINLFLFASDPINPIYLVILPITLLFSTKFSYKIRILALYCITALFIWLITSSSGGSRFILPFLPAYSLLTLITINYIKNKKIKLYLVVLIIVIAFSSILYRAIANYKYVPVILGLETKQEFLTNNLNFAFGDFYDTDGYFKKNIKSSDKVLLYGFHNLYYVDFNYIDSSWIKKGDSFNYIAVQGSVIPSRFSDWSEVYYNQKTNVRLYTKDFKQWQY